MSLIAQHIDKFLDTDALKALEAHIWKHEEEAAITVDLENYELVVVCRKHDIVSFLKFLRDDKTCYFKQLIDICGVDWLGAQGREKERFDVVYHLLSLSNNMRIRVKVRVADGDTVPSVTSLYSAANWFERETYDMFGIGFDDHPDLRRLLTDYDFDGHPLRKDFPLNGKVEVYYDEDEKRVAYKPVDLPQELRHFDGVSPWQGMTGNVHLAEEDNTFSLDEFSDNKEKTS